MNYYVEVLEGYIDEELEKHGGTFRFETASTKLFTIKCSDQGSMFHLWKTLQEQYTLNPDWEEVWLETSLSSASGYVQFRHRDTRSKIISMYTYKV